MTEPTRASSSPRHRGVVLVTGQSPTVVDRVADRLAGSTSRRVDSGPDVHDAADAVHRLALDLPGGRGERASIPIQRRGQVIAHEAIEAGFDEVVVVVHGEPSKEVRREE